MRSAVSTIYPVSSPGAFSFLFQLLADYHFLNYCFSLIIFYNYTSDFHVHKIYFFPAKPITLATILCYSTFKSCAFELDCAFAHAQLFIVLLLLKREIFISFFFLLHCLLAKLIIHKNDLIKKSNVMHNKLFKITYASSLFSAKNLMFLNAYKIFKRFVASSTVTI